MKSNLIGKLLSLVLVVMMLCAVTAVVSSAATENNFTLEYELRDCGKLKLTWDEVPGADAYDIYVDGVHTGSIFGEPLKQTYILSGLEFTDHVITVEASTSGGIKSSTINITEDELHHFLAENTTTVAPTCTEDGTITKICSCESKTVVITAEEDSSLAAPGHDFAPATCYLPMTCRVCSVTEGDALDHDWGEWISNGDDTHTRICANDPSHPETEDCTGGAATCEGKATCEVCNAEYGNVLGHSYGEWVSNDDGTHTKTCVNDAAHTITDNCVAVPTCTEDGVCADCGYTVDKLNHDWNEWTSNGDNTHTRTCNNADHPETEDCTGGAATCEGKAVCEVCNSEYGNVLGHSYGEWVSNDDGTHTKTCVNDAAHTITHDCVAVPTCTNDGVCADCGYTVDKLNHDWNDWTSNGNGTHTRTCNNADHPETENCSGGQASCTAPGVCEHCGGEYLSATDHDYPDVWTSNNNGTHSKVCANDSTHVLTENCSGGTATCEDQAVCEVCNVVYGDPLGHTESDWITDTDPDCTNPGTKHKECTVCHEELETGTIDAPGHTKGDWITDSDPDCTNPGTKHKECTVCHEELETGTIDAPGHTEGDWITDSDPDCTNPGTKHKECTVCHEELETGTIDAPGHTEGSWITDSYPDCTNPGSKHKECTVCHETVATESISANGHTEGSWITDKNPSCSVPGSKHTECTVCGDTIKTESIKLLDHTEGEWIKDSDPDCTTEGSKHTECTVCHTVIKTEAIAANGHDYEWHDVENESNGKTDFTYRQEICKVCNDKKEPVVDSIDVAETDKKAIGTVLVVVSSLAIVAWAVARLKAPATTTPWYKRKKK